MTFESKILLIVTDFFLKPFTQLSFMLSNIVVLAVRNLYCENE